MSERGPGVTGVLVMAYGTPASYEAVAGFYTDVRRGRPPSQEQLADLERRYAAVGGTSQLAARTQEQVAGIQRALDVQSPGSFVCRYGSKHAAPKIEDAVDQLTSLGVNGLVGIVLAPHYSSASVGEYVSRACARAGSAGLPAVFVEDWHDNPVLVELPVNVCGPPIRRSEPLSTMTTRRSSSRLTRSPSGSSSQGTATTPGCGRRAS